MKRRYFFAGIMLLAALAIHPVSAQNTDSGDTWQTFSFSAGAFLSYSSTEVRVGSGGGLSIDVEDALGLEKENKVFRLDSYWRFTSNRQHRLDFSWFSFNRSGEKVIAEDIVIRPPELGEIVIPTGTEVKSHFNLDIYQAAYSYSFLQDQRVDLAVQLGLYVMPIDFGLSVTGLVDEEARQKFTAPLPVVGMRLDVNLAPKWYLRGGSQIFYVQYEEFTGNLLDFKTALEYNPWKHVGFGLGFDALRLGLKADGSGDYPMIDLRGNLRFEYTGVMLYGRVFF